MALSNTATPVYYGKFRDAVMRGEIPVCKEISMEMNRIDDLIANPGIYYDDQAINGFIEYCEKELSILSVVDLHDIFDLLDAKILLNPKDKKAYTIYYFCIMSEIPNAYNRLLSILSRIDVSSIPFSLGNKFKEILLKL